MGEALSARQAAIYCGVAQTTVRRWLASGRLPATLKDGMYQIDPADLDAFMAHHGAHRGETGAPDGEPDGEQGARHPEPEGAPWQVMADLVAQNERLHREVVELSGRCGFYQARVQTLEEQVRQLSAPAADSLSPIGDIPASEPMPTDQASTETTNHPAGRQNGQDSAAQTTLRPWWKRTIRWLAQPV